MKIILPLAALLFATSLTAQPCTGYYYLQNGKVIEMTIYNKKGKETGKNRYDVNNVSTAGNTTTAVLNTTMTDEKGKELAKATNKIKCTDNSIMMDMKMFISGEQAKQYKTGDAAGEVYLDYPASIKAGDALPDGKLAMNLKQDNGLDSKIEIDITNRNVEVKEPVTTPAGTWDCFKITYKSSIKISMAGIGIPIRSDVTEWYAPGFGLVKSASKWGKTEITSIK